MIDFLKTMGVITSPALEARLLEQDQGGRPMSDEEFRRLQLEGMPPGARAAMLDAHARNPGLAQRQREALNDEAERQRRAAAAEQARLAALERGPRPLKSIAPVASTTRTEPIMTMTIEEHNRARELIAQMSQPLNEQERKICRMVGVSEADFLQQRNGELAAKLPNADSLTASERNVCRLLGMTPADFLASKAELGGSR